MVEQACRLGHDEYVKVLLRQPGIDVDGLEDGGYSGAANPLLLAILHGYTEVAVRLLRARASVHIVDGSGNTPLLVACGRRDVRLVDKLLKLRADPNVTARDSHDASMTPMSVVWKMMTGDPETQNSGLSIADALFRAGAKVDHAALAIMRKRHATEGPKILYKMQKTAMMAVEAEKHNGTPMTLAGDYLGHSPGTATDLTGKYRPAFGLDECCAFCGAGQREEAPVHLKVCAGLDGPCHARYCGPECQRAAWRAGHKASCGEPRCRRGMPSPMRRAPNYSACSTSTAATSA